MYLRTNVIFFILIMAGLTMPAKAQDTGTVEGTVLGPNSQPIVGVNIGLVSTNVGISTGSNGHFEISNIAPGAHKLRFSFVGFKTKTKPLTIRPGETARLKVHLKVATGQLRSVEVTALQPTLETNEKFRKLNVRRLNPQDPGELMRHLPGVNAVRRGPVGLDPVVRGLRETEVGTYLDGTRIFPGGPARMDSPLSHLDPSSIQTINVVKGPYALTWGAGNMTAVRVKTQPLTTLRKPFGGTLSSGYDTNTNALKEVASVRGRSGKIGYWLHGSWRKGQNYESGSGRTVPADFLSRGIRGKVGYKPTSNSYVDVSLGYQNQDNIDYPGRLLNADYFRTYNAAIHGRWNPENSIFEEVKASVYRNEVHHRMTNDGKPTAQADPNRKPPFALDIGLKAHAYVTGGRIFTTIRTASSWNWKIGADIYSANRDAVRNINKKKNGKNLFTNYIWPDATITDGGVYTKLSHSFTNRLRVSGTVRLDLVSARADNSSPFFKNKVSTDLDARETNLNGALTISYQLFDNWTAGLSGGSVVRTADATERYSDRSPASKAQTSAEFVGDPSLKPERNTQGDLWLSARYPRWNLKINGFARQMSHYITIKPTGFDKELPLSPTTVFQFTNGSAHYYGFDISGSYRFLPAITFRGSLNYLYGQDTELNEPALGVSPIQSDLGLRYDVRHLPLFLKGTVHLVGEQTRVATVKGETTTNGYTTGDIEAGATIFRNLSVQAGIQNVTDEQYVNHLNTSNPYSKQPIPEPGRVFHFDIQYQF